MECESICWYYRRSRLVERDSVCLQEILLATVGSSSSWLDGIPICWVGQKVHLDFSLKYTFFIFTNSFIDLDILRLSAISRIVEYWLFSINVSIWSLSTSTGLLNHGASSSEKSAARNFAKHFSHVQSVTAPSPYTAQIYFFCILVAFFPWNNKA